MANRVYNQFQGTIMKGVVTLFGRVSVAGAGAVTFQAWNPATKAYATATSAGYGGIKSVARTGAGLWTVTLQDSYQRVLFVHAMTSNATGASTVLKAGVDTDGDCTSNTTPTVMIVLSSATATALDPASGDKVDLMIWLQNSSAL